MFDREQPQPRYWKALVVTLVFTIPLALFARSRVPMTDLVWCVLTAGISLAIAWTIYSRMVNDWRTIYGMNLTALEKRNAVKRNANIPRD
jgi:hypothetical protein